MRIVSQDKTMDVNYDKVCMYLQGEKIRVCFAGDWFETLGTYATEERAKDVMADIRREWGKETEILYKTDFFETTSIVGFVNRNLVYEMPKE